MYGTVARMQARPGTGDALSRLVNEAGFVDVPGIVMEAIYRSDTVPNEYWLVVLFRSKEEYVANASSPAQDARYRKLRALLVADPEWHDGDIIQWTEIRP